MKQLLTQNGFGSALIVLGLLVPLSSVEAQPVGTASGAVTTSTSPRSGPTGSAPASTVPERAPVSRSGDSRGFDWGWIGLAGLIGLMGLAGRGRSNVTTS